MHFLRYLGSCCIEFINLIWYQFFPPVTPEENQRMSDAHEWRDLKEKALAWEARREEREKNQTKTDTV